LVQWHLPAQIQCSIASLIRFFDNYVIPLAKKLKECEVFGAASDECLNYAISNRSEWEEKGETIVAQFIASVTTRA
jgi:hypothetical protein